MRSVGRCGMGSRENHDKRLDPYRFDVGRARVEPEDPIVAGAFFTRKIIFTAGTLWW